MNSLLELLRTSPSNDKKLHQAPKYRFKPYYTSILNLNYLSLAPQMIKWWIHAFSTPCMYRATITYETCMLCGH